MAHRQLRAKSGREQMQQVAPLLDHLVGACEERGRHFEAERLGGLEIDYQFELAYLFNRQVGRLRSLENFTDVIAAHVKAIAEDRSVAH